MTSLYFSALSSATAALSAHNHQILYKQYPVRLLDLVKLTATAYLLALPVIQVTDGVSNIAKVLCLVGESRKRFTYRMNVAIL